MGRAVVNDFHYILLKLSKVLVPTKYPAQYLRNYKLLCNNIYAIFKTLDLNMA